MTFAPAIGSAAPLTRIPGDITLLRPAARNQQHSLGETAAHMELAPLAREARKIDETVEEFGGHLRIQQNLRILRLAVDGEKPDDLLLMQRKMVQLQRHCQGFVEIELTQVVQIPDIIAPGPFELDGERGVLPLARHVRKRRDRIDMKLGLRRSGPFDELRQILLLETAVISRRLLLGRTLRGRIETAGIKNQRDGMLAEPAGAACPQLQLPAGFSPVRTRVSAEPSVR